MKKLRPTIPVAEWKLAIHLQATLNLQNQPGVPADGCLCAWCARWKACWRQVLPENLQAQLNRAGVDLTHPTDVYAFGADENEPSIRVIYHAVGKVLDGPNPWQRTETGKRFMYRTLRQEPHVAFLVYPQRQSDIQAPVLKDRSAGELICFDFRLALPNQVSQAPTAR
ncbi:hypothetical protein [Photobacterium sp. 53610]|uniref:hypothetical protein n=1 Tax=Photobacterium sp. 53610 TaxID=3102789 RepID=UPI002ED8F74A